MSRKPINWKVEENDVKEFIKPINIEIPIDKGQYDYIFDKKETIKNISASEYFRFLEKEMLNKLFPGKNYDRYKRILNSKISLSYIPNFKDNNWVIGYSPVKIFNDIFETLNIDYRLDYIDYSNKSKVTRVKNLILVRLVEERLKSEKDKNIERFNFINDCIAAINNIFLFNGYDIETRMKSAVIYKNLLYYLSVKSLDILDETDNELYSYIPRQYYNEVTTSEKKSEHPKQLFMRVNEVYDYNYNMYNIRFERVMHRYPKVFEEVLGIDEISVMERLDILKNDIFISDIEMNYSNYKKKRSYTKTDEELSSMLKDKIEFYKKLLSLTDENGDKVVVSPVKGKNDLYGYYGFVLNNNYIVLDKFYNLCKRDDTMKPAADEAIYSMPLDLFVNFKGSKSKIMEYIKKNPKSNVKRNYHTKKHSYREKILKITKKENVSTMNSEWFLNIYSPKKLTLNNN